jgi:hypothetical protein
MTINVQETWESQQGSIQADETGISGETRLIRVFTWTSALPISSTVEVLIAPSTPKINDPHPTLFFARVRNVTVTQEGPSYGKINVEYDVASAGTGPGDGDPTLQPPELRWSSVQTEEPIDEDINGQPITTPNGEAIFGLTETVYDLQLSISRNILTFSPEVTYLFQNKVNSEPFLGFPPGVVLCSNISATNVIDGSFNYVRFNVEFLFRAPLRTIPLRAWWKRVLCEGTQARYLRERRDLFGADLVIPPFQLFQLVTGTGQFEGINLLQLQDQLKEVTNVAQARDSNNEMVGSPVALNVFGFSRQSWELANKIWKQNYPAFTPIRGFEFEPHFLEYQTKAYEDLNFLGLLPGV